MQRVYLFFENIFDRIHRFWERASTHRWISRLLVSIFLLSALTGLAVEKGYLPPDGFFSFFSSPFIAIEIAFGLLLITEIFSLIFILPVSVAKSVGKQFELLSLIFIRYAFKEFSHIHRLEWSDMENVITAMFVFAIGSVFIFSMVGLLYKIQRRTRICESFVEDTYFKRFRKFIALLILLAFVVILAKDFIVFFRYHVYNPSFHDFYGILIFSDILILLVSIRYSLDYHSMYRYSGYILATIFIRIALTAPAFANIIIGLGGIIYLLGLTWTYNYFLQRQIHAYPYNLYYYPKGKKFKKNKHYERNEIKRNR